MPRPVDGGEVVGRCRVGGGDGVAGRRPCTPRRAGSSPPAPSRSRHAASRSRRPLPRAVTARRGPAAAARPTGSTGVDLGEQRARLAPVATAPPGPRDHQAIRRPRQRRRAAGAPPRPSPRRWSRCGGGPSPVSTPVTTTVLHSRPLAPWNVSSSTPPSSLAERAHRRQPDRAARRRRRAVARAGSRARSAATRRSAASSADRRRCRATSCAHSRRRVADGRRGGGRGDRRSRAATRAAAARSATGTPARAERGGQPGELVVRPGEHGDIARRARRRGRACARTRRRARPRASRRRRRRCARAGRRPATRTPGAAGLPRGARPRRRRRSAASSGGSRAGR